MSGGVPARVAVVGAGVIGSGWAGLFAAYGAEVRVFDPDPAAESRARAALTDAVRLGVGVAHLGSVDACGGLAYALEGAGWVQESLPESLGAKREMLAALAPYLAPDAVVASSTSSFTADELADGVPYAERLLVAHPLQPVYAVPVVELCGGARTAATTMRRARAVLRAAGREPVTVRAPVPGLVANRLTAALLREAFDLVASGVVSAADLERVVARGIALGWVAAGPLSTEAIGAGGFAAFLRDYEAPLARLWASLADWPALDPARRAALLRAVTDALGDAGGDEKAHASGDSAWAETLARVLRAAGGENWNG